MASGGNYTVSPSQNGFSLTPGSRTYQNLTANVTNANFAGVTVTPPSSGFPFSKTINYAYNNVGALAGVGMNLIGTDANNTTNVINSLSFKAFGALKQLNYGNGLQLTMGYNANRQQPVSMKVGPNGTGSIIDYTYEYYDQDGHNNNRIRSITDGVDSAYSVSYTYDKWNRLTHATLGSAGNVNSRYYTYDAFGNLRSAWRGDATYGGVQLYALNYAVNATTAPATNRIYSVMENGGTQGFTYDNAGNLTQGDGMTYAYDAANRMTSVNNGALGQYWYDGAGMRVKKVEGGGTTFYVRSSLLKNTAFELTSAGGNECMCCLVMASRWLSKRRMGNFIGYTQIICAPHGP